MALHDHAFHVVRIGAVVDETPDARSFVLDVPDELRESFAYQAGQFCTFRVQVEGRTELRCYSMCSAPGFDTDLRVTVKRVPDGVVSNWMNDALRPGDEIEATCPTGVFVLAPGDADLVAFAGGSGITPIMSLVKAALATTARRVRLFYANRDQDGVIFRAELDELAERYGERLEVVHHLDAERGLVQADAAAAFAGVDGAPDVYLCGPTPFMDLVEERLLADGLDPDRIRVERFTPAEPVEVEPADPATAPSEITIELGGRTESTTHHPGTTVLQTARQVGLAAPSSCEAGNCATCMARLVEGEVTMRSNHALTEEEVAEGWILTCQSVPASPTVRVVYEGV